MEGTRIRFLPSGGTRGLST